MKKLLSVILIACMCFGCANKPVEEEENPTYTIDTVYTELTYPEQWKDQIRTEKDKDGDSISFYAVMDDKEALLFKIEFNKSEGYLLGKLGDTKIYTVDGGEPNEEWSDYQKECFYTMQEDVNVILDGLKANKDFKLAK